MSAAAKLKRLPLAAFPPSTEPSGNGGGTLPAAQLPARLTRATVRLVFATRTQVNKLAPVELELLRAAGKDARNPPSVLRGAVVRYMSQGRHRLDLVAGTAVDAQGALALRLAAFRKLVPVACLSASSPLEEKAAWEGGGGREVAELAQALAAHLPTSREVSSTCCRLSLGWLWAGQLEAVKAAAQADLAGVAALLEDGEAVAAVLPCVAPPVSLPASPQKPPTTLQPKPALAAPQQQRQQQQQQQQQQVQQQHKPPNQPPQQQSRLQPQLSQQAVPPWQQQQQQQRLQQEMPPLQQQQQQQLQQAMPPLQQQQQQQLQQAMPPWQQQQQQQHHHHQPQRPPSPQVPSQQRQPPQQRDPPPPSKRLRTDGGGSGGDGGEAEPGQLPDPAPAAPPAAQASQRPASPVAAPRATHAAQQLPAPPPARRLADAPPLQDKAAAQAAQPAAQAAHQRCVSKPAQVVAPGGPLEALLLTAAARVDRSEKPGSWHSCATLGTALGHHTKSWRAMYRAGTVKLKEMLLVLEQRGHVQIDLSKKADTFWRLR